MHPDTDTHTNIYTPPHTCTQRQLHSHADAPRQTHTHTHTHSLSHILHLLSSTIVCMLQILSHIHTFLFPWDLGTYMSSHSCPIDTLDRHPHRHPFVICTDTWAHTDPPTALHVSAHTHASDSPTHRRTHRVPTITHTFISTLTTYPHIYIVLHLSLIHI